MVAGTVERIARSEVKMSIQTIDTAPRDGTSVMLWVRWEDTPCIAGFRHGRWVPDMTFVDAEGGWEGAVVVSRIEQSDITHWSPIPAAPVREQG